MRYCLYGASGSNEGYAAGMVVGSKVFLALLSELVATVKGAGLQGVMLLPLPVTSSCYRESDWEIKVAQQGSRAA